MRSGSTATTTRSGIHDLVVRVDPGLLDDAADERLQVGALDREFDRAVHEVLGVGHVGHDVVEPRV